MPRDWLKESHLIALTAPALGNPLDLLCGEFDAHLSLAVNGSDESNSDQSWHRQYVESMR